MEGIVVPLGAFVFLGAIIIVPIWLRNRAREAGYRLIHEAMARGQVLDPKLIEQIVEVRKDKDGPRWRRSLGAGVALAALAAGLVGVGLADGYDSGWIKGAAVLGSLGAGFIVLAVIDVFTRKSPDQ